MGGFLQTKMKMLSMDGIMFPAPLEVWVGSYIDRKYINKIERAVSGPSRGMGGFLQTKANVVS